MLQLYNRFSHYEPSGWNEWERILKTKYGDRLMRVGIPGIEDMTILDSFRRIRLGLHPSGNFILILLTNDEGYVFPQPWLRFNDISVTSQLEPFYNRPEHGSEGITEAVEKPAHVRKLQDGRWEVVEKGIIRFQQPPPEPEPRPESPPPDRAEQLSRLVERIRSKRPPA